MFTFLFSVSTGEGKHWFVIIRTSEHLVEIFDSLGSSKNYIKDNIRYEGVFEYNTFPVQCQDSYYCGAFAIYFLVERYSNLDLEFEELLNDIFSPTCEENQQKVKEFLLKLDYKLK